MAHDLLLAFRCRYTNALLNKAGHFSAMEGGMGGLAGTQDQRIAAHSFYFKFFTATVRITSRSIPPQRCGGQLDLVWLPARTMHPHEAYTW